MTLVDRTHKGPKSAEEVAELLDELDTLERELQNTAVNWTGYIFLAGIVAVSLYIVFADAVKC